ncbi:hypothetical protein [Rhizobium mesoamericanum]|uniref:hypothetical protein n=1 Tax=Rhizobium mesoamericanum TaxID=1079800 RepID=UPI0003F697B8|nr:hypothetical protein [Rhizobium mesoamericanum]
MTPRYHRHDEPLTSEDLSKCTSILEEFCTANNVALTSDDAERVAAIIIELYQQGVHELHHLRPLVDAATGILADPTEGRKG